MDKVTMRKISFGGLKPVLIFCVTIIVILTLSRFALSVWLHEQGEIVNVF